MTPPKALLKSGILRYFNNQASKGINQSVVRYNMFILDQNCESIVKEGLFILEGTH